MTDENDHEQDHNYLGFIREGVAQEGFDAPRSLPETELPNRHHQHVYNNTLGASSTQSKEPSPALSYTTPSFPQTHSDFARHPVHNGAGSGRGSSVSIDHFDPVGVHELRRTMSHMSQDPDRHLDPRLDDKERSKSGPAVISSAPVGFTDGSSLDSGATLNTNSGEGAFDFEKSLRYHTKKRDELSIKSRSLGVLFENLHVVGLGASALFQPTLGSVLPNPFKIPGKIKASRHPPLRDILYGFEGVVRPGEMLLVLGRPGSGCSTLLKTLANQREEYHAVTGDVHYDSLTPDEIARHYRGDVQYCPEDDVHFPTLSVEQTIKFAAKTRAPNARVDNQSREEYTDFITDVYTTIFGLNHVRKTPVGDNAIRGVSGGEKKRVSISEALASRSLLCAWDNSTRGLDASTALEFVKALRIATDVERTSTIVSIYQAGESLYEVFDKVCLIYEGKMAYYGPANQARQYFIDMGYEPANRQTTADFLVSVTDPHGRIKRKTFSTSSAASSSSSSLPTPRIASEFADYYNKSSVRKLNLADMQAYREEFVGKSHIASAFKESARAEHAKRAREKSPYTISVPMQVKAVMVRRAQIIQGNYTAQALSTTTFVLQAIILGTTYLKIPRETSAYFSRGGIIFFSLFLPALFSMAEIPALFAQRPIILRHQKAAMYHPFIEALAMTLVDIPMTFITTTLYTIILYFLIDLQRTAGQFFIFFLFVFTITLAMKAFFRSLAAAFTSAAPAQAIAGIMLLALSLYTGYNIPLPSMIGALKWISYINPIRYAFEALMTNEFHTLDGTCSDLVPSGAGYEGVALANQVCPTIGSQVGRSTVSGAQFVAVSFGYYQSHLWRNYGILIAFGVAFLVALLIFTEYNTGSAGESDVVLFKAGSKAAVLDEAAAEVGDDEEKGQADARASAPVDVDREAAQADKEAEAVMAEQKPMTNVFSWQHINYVVDVGGGEKKQLLRDVSGFVAPGKLTALMGESGAGKTTLLNVLAERVGTGVVSGGRFINGQELPPDFQAQTGYCQQMDTHIGTSTVRESLIFSARMRQPESVPTSEKDEYAEKCLKMCGLEAFADASVGSLGVEHRKRTTIAVELAAKPQLLLFLDEPTSGLDSQSAWAIMTFLRNLANNGQAILCTIHQPSAELFQVFDRLLLLRKGGQTVYFGDLGHNATTLIEYFETRGSRKCRPDENPAEFILDVIGAGATAVSDRDWHQVWAESDNCTNLDSDIDRIHKEGRSHPPVSSTLQSEFATSWIYQTRGLLRRGWDGHWRNPSYLMSKITLNIIGGLFIGFTFFKSKHSLQGTQNKLFAIFMGTILSAPLGGQIHVPFIETRNIYKIRERSSRTYRWSALITSQILVELPWNILGSTLFFICWYWTVGFEHDRAGYTYLMFGVLFPMYYTTIALTVSAMSPTAEIAGILYSFLFSFVLLFDGVIQPYSQLNWWVWMYRLSPFTYLIEGLLGQAIGHQEITCSSKEYSTLEPPSGSTCASYLATYISNKGGYLLNPDATSACQFCSSRTTDQFFGPRFNISYDHRWRNVGLFCAYIVFNTFAVYIFTYLFQIRSGNPLAFIKRRIASRKA